MTRRTRAGMALIEVMIAVLLILIMSMASFAILQDSIDTREMLSERDEVTRASRVVLGKIRRELTLAYLTKNLEAINTYETVFVGTDDNPDRIIFDTLSHQRIYRDSRECDQTEVTWWTEDAEEGPGYTLFHREGPRIDEEPDKDGVIYPLAYNVRTFDLRYLDGNTNEWVAQWDTRTVDQANRLPRAVQVGIVLILEEKDGRSTHTVEVPILTTVVLHYAPPLALTPLEDLSGQDQ
jgi:general secretion pathway protein J